MNISKQHRNAEESLKLNSSLNHVATALIADKAQQDFIADALRPQEASHVSTSTQGYCESDALDEELLRIREERRRKIQETRDTPPHHSSRIRYGEVETIDESDFLPRVTCAHLSVCHFFNEEFQRCKIMDAHMNKLAKLMPCVSFLRLNAAKAPFFTSKLKIVVLPSLVIFRDGIVQGMLTGFEELGGRDDFPTAAIASWLKRYGALGKEKKSIRGDKMRYNADGEDDVGDDDTSSCSDG